MTNFLTVPAKKTSEVDFVKPLRTFIASTYSTVETASIELDEAVNEFNKLRNKAAVQHLEAQHSSVDLLARYYDQLVAIENKLPFTPTQIPICFKWKDAFDKGSIFFGRQSLTLSYGSLEQASILFNMAALMSRIGASQSLSTDEELKTTAKLFQQSAGVFVYLKDSVLSAVQHELTSDLMPDTLSALTALMVAQAQEAIYLKAAKDRMKPALIVKIAAQCHDFYQDAVKQFNREVVKGLWEKEWIAILNGKMLAFDGLAQYYQSLENSENKKVGEELSRLQEALKSLDKAQNYFTSAGISAFQTEHSLVQKAFDMAKKDNDFIYHERIPEFRTLPALPRASLAKPLPVSTPMSPRFKDMFETLVPAAVNQAMVTFNARKAQVINMETGRLREYTQLLNRILASLNLPAGLDDIVNQETLPESIKDKSARVKAAGGIQEIRKLIASLPESFSRNNDLLEQTSRMISEEKQSDDQLRSQFKEKWTRMESAKLNETLWQEVGKYSRMMDTAKTADGVVKQKLVDNEKGIQMLSNTESQLKAAIPGLTANNDAHNIASVTKLRDLLNQVNDVISQREVLEKEINRVPFDMKTVFLTALGESGAFNEEELSTEKINQMYAPMRQRLTESIQWQEKLTDEIQKANKQFCIEKSGSASGAEREYILKTLAASYDAFTQLLSNLKEGQKFYGDLTPLLIRLQEKVSDFCFARKTEKEDLMRDLQQNILSQTGSAGPTPNYQKATDCTTTAPSRPPPPVFSQASHPIPPPRNVHVTQAGQCQSNEPQQQYLASLYAPQQPMGYQSAYAGPAYPYPQHQAFPYPTAAPYHLAYPGTYPGATNLYNTYGYQPMVNQPQQNQPMAPPQPPQHQ